jgi:hypothetical protein
LIINYKKIKIRIKSKNKSDRRQKIRPSERGRGGRRVQGGNSATPEPKRSPAALLAESRAKQKNFLFLLEEKSRRAQIQISKGNFSAGHASGASGGGAERQFRSKKFRAKFRISHQEVKICHFGQIVSKFF